MSRSGRRRWRSQLRDVPSREVSRLLAEEALFASHGDFYATTVVERLGLAEQGLVRVGLACYSTRRGSGPAGGGGAADC